MTDTETPTAIEGRPITGEISKGDHRSAEQWDAAKFLEMLDAVLNTPGVLGVTWQQYTPYFNDGETCEFNAYSFAVALSEPPPGVAPDYEDYGDDGNTAQGYFDTYNLYDYVDGVRVPKHPVYESLSALDGASDHFLTVLYDHFGDHAIVRATRDGFTVETYEHD